MIDPFEKNYKVKKMEKISMPELKFQIQKNWNYLLSKWLIICIFGFGGGAIGLTSALLQQPSYTATLTFLLVESSSGGGGLASLASSFGLGDIGGNNGVFSGSNLLEIIKSKSSIEKTLLTPVEYHSKKQNLIDIYLQFTGIRGSWENESKNPELKSLEFPIGQPRETFTRTQDSIINSIYNDIIRSKSLTINKNDKKTDLVNIEFTCSDEYFSKVFVESIMEETYRFYMETRISQSKANIEMMQEAADSIKRLYDSSIYKSATASQFNINPALQLASIPRIKQETNVELYGKVYAEILKNLETLKMDMLRQKPIVQIIDHPRYPLKVNKTSKTKGLIVGGIIGGLLIVSLLLLASFTKNLFEESNDSQFEN
jgi:hypothetical protein